MYLKKVKCALNRFSYVTKYLNIHSFPFQNNKKLSLCIVYRQGFMLIDYIDYCSIIY